MPNSCVCKAAEGTNFIFFKKNAFIISVWAKTLWVQDYFKLQFCFSHYKDCPLLLRSDISSYSETCWSFLTFWHLKSILVILVCTCLLFHKVKHWISWFHSLNLSIAFPLPFIQRLQLSKPPPPIVFPHFRDFIIVGCLLSWLLSALKSQFPICSSSHWSFNTLSAILAFIIFWTS